jgi:hypothetical protein
MQAAEAIEDEIEKIMNGIKDRESIEANAWGVFNFILLVIM